MLRVSIVFILILTAILWVWHLLPDKKPAEPKRFNGVNLEAPRNPVGDSCFNELSHLHASWVAVIPYGFIGDSTGEVKFDHARQWWGEKEEGVREVIRMAHANHLKVMLKPQVWVRGDGWPGDFMPNSEDAWETWQKSYRSYLMSYALLAAEMDVSMICIGTEFRRTATQRPEYWRGLIRELRSFYNGDLTYAANWDNYQNISFWDELDYIGIDAYFPLSDRVNPSEDELVAAWKELGVTLRAFTEEHRKKILFTEYGYRSVQGAARGHWNEADDPQPDNQAQAMAYKALYSSVWQEPWLAGGFLWKWHMTEPRNQGYAYGFSPQKKPAERIIRQAYTGQ